MQNIKRFDVTNLEQNVACRERETEHNLHVVNMSLLDLIAEAWV
jgi:hypothetical protein